MSRFLFYNRPFSPGPRAVRHLACWALNSLINSCLLLHPALSGSGTWGAIKAARGRAPEDPSRDAALRCKCSHQSSQSLEDANTGHKRERRGEWGFVSCQAALSAAGLSSRCSSEETRAPRAFDGRTTINPHPPSSRQDPRRTSPGLVPPPHPCPVPHSQGPSTL